MADAQAKIESTPPADGEDSLTADHLTADQRTALREQAHKAAKACGWVSQKKSPQTIAIFRRSLKSLRALEKDLYQLRSGEPSADLKWLYDNLRLIHSYLEDLSLSFRDLARLPLVRTADEEAIPRVVVLARAMVSASEYRLTQPAFECFVKAVEEIEPLRLTELSGVLLAVKLSLLESLAKVGHKALEAFKEHGAQAPSLGIGAMVGSLRLIGEVEWREVLESLSVVHLTLLGDPAGIYPRMEPDTRAAYCGRVAQLAAHSDSSEIEIAKLALTMAGDGVVESGMDEALRLRLRHVGYYLMDETGSQELRERIFYRLAPSAFLQNLFRHNPDECYIIGIEFVTLITVAAVIMTLVRSGGGWGLILAGILLLLPATQAAVELVNYLVTTVLVPEPLSKLDFSEAVDADSSTIVAIPALLINEKQIKQLVEELEIRYLVNRDPNIYYALLTDLPDTAEPPEETDQRIDLCTRLIEGLNRKYSEEPYGGFYLFHRHRVFNPREGSWMGWERKRGKLLDLNQYLRSAFDPFPVKVGDLSRLPKAQIRYVLTLDSDTQLPRGSAQRLIGAMAHPLNRPLIDPERNVVTEGYGILQPRVGISVHTESTSRLARIYSGQTGFDIYSRAVSDVYQDLYREAIFTGKGIYDVDALRQVLERRFPRNALLSHDLIEGAYARAGLASDIEVIDDYPSHYSAYNRRKHRWLRGDWQIVRWIFNRVPDETRKLVRNPISLVSRWKILDNLRRSLMEPASFFLLVAGWFFLTGGPRFWTFVSLALFFLPIYFRLVFALVRSTLALNWMSIRTAFADFFTSHVAILLNIVFLAHQTVVSIDAIVRTVIRTQFTHRSLLEWETAIEAELGIRKRTPVDIYLDWIPVLAILLGAALFLRPEAAPYALPFLLAWCCSKLFSKWINRAPNDNAVELTSKDRLFLRSLALRTWRYFSRFSTAENHWLIPDNVQEEPYREAERLSPTNLGFLFNARQAALEFGYITLSEFVLATERTLESVAAMPRFHGHLVNWYDNQSLQPLEPRIVSSVDSGNLAASLLALKHGCLELLHTPILSANALEGLTDYCRSKSTKSPSPVWRDFLASKEAGAWIPTLFTADFAKGNPPAELQERLAAVREEAARFLPWYLPEFEPLRKLSPPEDVPSPGNAAAFCADLARNLTQEVPAEHSALAQQLAAKISEARDNLSATAVALEKIAEQCERLFAEMDFSIVVNEKRKLLSIGYDEGKQKLSASCYDLLASEARIATFIAVIKDDAVQDSWFRLGRQHTVCENETVLLSWTGTMFEYLMPSIWMRSHPDTLIARAVRSAVRAQQSYAAKRGVPWGISESAYAKTDESSNYQYAAFGVPGLALNVARAGYMVVSPYSSCLAVMVDAAGSVENLRKMERQGWLAEFGFYESADYTGSVSRGFLSRKPTIVRSFMAHHQGMSLTAICNLLHENPFQRWFHAERRVQASELILHERPLRVKPIADLQPKRVTSGRTAFAAGHPTAPQA